MDIIRSTYYGISKNELRGLLFSGDIKKWKPIHITRSAIGQLLDKSEGLSQPTLPLSKLVTEQIEDAKKFDGRE